MPARDALNAGSIELEPGLAQQHVDQQPAANPDAAMHAPDRQRDALAVECLVPGEDVLIDAVDERAVEIEQERGVPGHDRDDARVARDTPHAPLVASVTLLRRTSRRS